MKDKLISKIIFISSMAIFGTLAVFVRNIQLPSAEIALYRALFAIILIGLFMLVKKQKIPFSSIKKELPLLLLSGIAMGINWIFLFEAYNYTSVSTATLSYYFAPILVTTVSTILFKEKLNIKQIVCFIMSTLGIVLITGVGKLSGSSDYIGILFGLSAATLYATVVLINKFIKSVSGINRTFLQFISAFIVLVPYVLLSGGIHLGTLNTKGLVCLLIIGIIHTAITYCMYFSSLKDLSGQTVAILSYIDPLVAVAISVLFLKESMTILQLLGGILILGFTMVNELPQNKK